MVFTGIIQSIGKANYLTNSFRLKVFSNNFFKNIEIGSSVSINGVCLTVVDFQEDYAYFDVMEETRKLTNLGYIKENEEIIVNLERSAKFGNEIGGHIVQGHIDGIGKIINIEKKKDNSQDLWINFSELTKNWNQNIPIPVVYKGSICIDGVSLTIAELNLYKHELRISLIPHTIQVTNFQYKNIGDLVNIEFDHSLSNHFTNQYLERISQKENIDYYFMMQAIEFGELSKSTAPPNPWVGCILVFNNKEIGRGRHIKVGTSHAEIIAIQDAIQKGNSNLIEGSTMYVTLEPCHHFGRTPPCDLEIIKRKIKRVVVAILDPDPRVNGKGIEHLKQNGITVDIDICSEKAKESLLPYIYHRTTGLPYVLLKSALSLDSKISCEDFTSQWITGEKSREDVHKKRAFCQAIIIGSGTALKDLPKLTVRLENYETENNVQPLRVILDTNGKVIFGSLMDQKLAPTLIFTSKNVNENALKIWKSFNIEYQFIPITNEGLLDIKIILEELGKRGIIQVMIEGGALLQSNFLKNDLVNKMVLYYGNCLIGMSGKNWLQQSLSRNIKEVKRWKLVKIQQFDDDICAEYMKLEEKFLLHN